MQMTLGRISSLIFRMEPDFGQQLERILANLSEAEVYEGLKPTEERLTRLFGMEDADLTGFCFNYVKMVPRQSRALAEAGRTLSLSDVIDPYVLLSHRYLTAALTELGHSDARGVFESFMILLQGAYIFGRMQEELDDKVQAFIGVPLTHVDLMEANLIVHDLLGDNFANRLDKVVASLVQQSKISRSIIEANLDQQQIKSAKEMHLSLTGEPVKSFAERYGFGMTQGLL